MESSRLAPPEEREMHEVYKHGIRAGFWAGLLLGAGMASLLFLAARFAG